MCGGGIRKANLVNFRMDATQCKTFVQIIINIIFCQIVWILLSEGMMEIKNNKYMLIYPAN